MTHMAPNFNAIPVELRSVPRWVLWKGQKVPYSATALNSKASVTDPQTWASFGQAQTAFHEGGYAGVGFVLNGDGIVGIDLDQCVHDGEPVPAALTLLDSIGCDYIEFSPSRTGLHAYGYGDNISGKRGEWEGVKVELYARDRYLTVTGQTVRAGELVPLKGFTDIANCIGHSDLQKGQKNLKSCSSASSGSSGSSVGFPRHTLPTREGERNKCLFELARYVKGTNPGATREELHGIVRQWHALALPVIGTKDFTATWGDFLRGWDAVRHPFGESMRGIIGTVDQTELPAAIEPLCYSTRGQHLVRLCIALQAHHGAEPFFLSARQAGEIIGVHFSDASKMLYALVRDGVLQLVSRGAGKKASRYRLAALTLNSQISPPVKSAKTNGEHRHQGE